MKKIKKIYILILLFLMFILKTNISSAEAAPLVISSDKTKVEEGEEINVSIELKSVKVASFTLEIYWDTTRLEYINGPQNSNNLSNRILYSWISDNGENKDNILIDGFKFKAIQDGTANIVATGEFYNSNGELLDINDNNLEIKIRNFNEQAALLNEIQENVSSDNSDNTNLSVLRLNHEGISPDFNKDIREYYFIANTSIDNLEVTAIPENSKSTVTVTGNYNLILGENTIDIKVESEDKTKTSIYKIYVTRTDNIDAANANLETLAIREGTLTPEFSNNMTQYQVEIPNGIENINILAIPQIENATVKILGNDKINVGDNKIQVIVTAENGTTIKKYYINVHRRSETEETEYHIEEELQAKKLSSIMQEDNIEEKIESSNQVEETELKNKNIALIIIVAIILIVLVAFLVYKHKFRKKT